MDLYVLFAPLIDIFNVVLNMQFVFHGFAFTMAGAFIFVLSVATVIFVVRVLL